MFNIVVFISGNGSNLKAIIEHIKIKKLAINIELVISNKKNILGIEIAKKNNISVEILEKNNISSLEYAKKLDNTLQKYKTADLIVLAGFMLILDAYFVDKYIGKIINIHPSILPKYKGLDTHKKALENKDKYHGVTIHWVENELDSGKIIMQNIFCIEELNSEEKITKQIHKIEHYIYPLCIEACLNKTFIYKK
jgi:formyltetrahydrofolate-dependent phosphoribosylglycinamide formyltransferase